MRIAAVVVLYNPSGEVVKMISSYLNQVEHVFIVDNSTRVDEPLKGRIQSLSGISYHSNEGNQGIAHALNVGARLAMANGFDYLLTMDQDTLLPQLYVSKLQSSANSNSHSPAAIVAPAYYVEGKTLAEGVHEVPWTMTSGNILSLKAYRDAGPFMDRLFIDHVDHEYCLRLRKIGYKIIQVNDVSLKHRPGEVKGFALLGRELTFSVHSPTRLYYFCRNGFVVARRYIVTSPGFSAYFAKLFCKEVFKIFFLPDRMVRIKLVWRAFRDFVTNKLGPIHQTAHE